MPTSFALYLNNMIKSLITDISSLEKIETADKIGYIIPFNKLYLNNSYQV